MTPASLRQMIEAATPPEKDGYEPFVELADKLADQAPAILALWEAAQTIATIYEKSVDVGPLSTSQRGLNRENIAWTELRAALAGMEKE